MRSCKSESMWRPNNRMVPESGAVMLTIMRIVVVLPAPFGPSSPNTRPARTVKAEIPDRRELPKTLAHPIQFYRYLVRGHLALFFCACCAFCGKIE